MKAERMAECRWAEGPLFAGLVRLECANCVLNHAHVSRKPEPTIGSAWVPGELIPSEMDLSREPARGGDGMNMRSEYANLSRS